VMVMIVVLVIIIATVRLYLHYVLPSFLNTLMIFFFFFFLVFRDRVSLYSPGCPGTHFVDQAGLCLPSAGIKGMRHHSRQRFIYLFIYLMYVHCRCLQTPQKRASALVTDGYEPPRGCWDLNSGPSEEQSGALTH
jgi:hypothetical protein